MTLSLEIKTFGGNFSDINLSQEYLTLNFSPSSTPRNRRWRNYGLSADFLGDYFATFFPGDERLEGNINRRDAVKGAVSYVANELIENAVKYSDLEVALPISISLYLNETSIVFQATNWANQGAIEKYQSFIVEFLNSDADEFFMRQLEKTALGGGESNMGILTMNNDYGAQFGWQFQPHPEHLNLEKVTVMVRLAI